MATNVLETLDAVNEAATAAAWTMVRDILRRADRPKKDDHLQLAKAMESIGITRADLPELASTIAEFDALADADAQAQAAGERVANTREMRDKEIEKYNKLVEESRLAIARLEAHIRGVNVFLADAEQSASQALERKARRNALIIERADLLGTHADAAGILAANEAALAEEATRNREVAERDALQSALDWRLMDSLPHGEVRRRIVDVVARHGKYRKHDVDPAHDKDGTELEPSYGDASAAIQKEIIDHRNDLLSQLLAGQITKAEAGPAVVSMGVYLGKLPKDGSNPIPARTPSLAANFPR